MLSTEVRDLTHSWLQIVKKIPDSLVLDEEEPNEENTLSFPGGHIISSSELFSSSGRVLVDSAQEILHYAEAEKVKLLIGAYSQDWEEFFAFDNPQSSCIVQTAGSSVKLTYDNKIYKMSIDEFDEFIDTFVGGPLKSYQRIKHRWKRYVTGSFDKTEYEIDHHVLKLSSGLCYHNLAHQ